MTDVLTGDGRTRRGRGRRFVLVFLVAGLLGIAGGAPFTALQVLWVNIIMDGPPAMALGLDRPDDDVMRRGPRPVGEPILTRERIVRIALAATVMAVGTLGVLTLTPQTAGVAGTLAFTTFVLFQFANLLNVRSREATVFARRTLTNRALWLSLGAIVALQVAVVHVPALQEVFSTTALSPAQWATAVAVASSVLGVEEVRKAVARHRHARESPSPRSDALP